MARQPMKVSIITVCFNAEKTIARTIESVAAQSYPDIEYIIIDGGSSDATLSIIDRYRHVVSRLVSEPDRGIYDAMNKGIRAATGEVIGIINADDYYRPDAVRIAVDYLERGFDYVFGSVQVGDKVICRLDPHKAWYTNQIATKHTVGFFVRKHCHDILGLYDTRYRIAADLDFFYKLLKSPFKGTKTLPEEIFGEFTRDGISSQEWFQNIWEDTLIRYRQNQSRIFLLLLLNARILFNFRQFLRRSS